MQKESRRVVDVWMLELAVTRAWVGDIWMSVKFGVEDLRRE
jgi:hypothetical protein